MAHDMNKAENRTCCPKCGEKWNTKGKDEEDPLEILLAKPVDHLEPNIRVRNILEKAGAKTIRDIVKMTRRDFLRYRGAGPKSLEELKEVLAKYGLALKSKKIG
jgi:DNA-directed RNA polymerase subunit alpha